ncbi:MAG: hypothetical protein ACRD2G_11945 [Terriglobia bacterium]
MPEIILGDLVWPVVGVGVGKEFVAGPLLTGLKPFARDPKVIDLAGEQRTDTALLRQAIREALARGLVRRSQFEREGLPPLLRREFQVIAGAHA